MSTPSIEDAVATNSSTAEPIVSQNGVPSSNHAAEDGEAAPAASSNGTTETAGLETSDSPADPIAPPHIKDSLTAPRSPSKSPAEVWGSVVQQLSPTASARADQTQHYQPHEAAAVSSPGVSALNGTAPSSWPTAGGIVDTAAAAPTTAASDRDMATEGLMADSGSAATVNGGPTAAADSSSSDDDLPLSMRTRAEPPGEAAVGGGCSLASGVPSTVNGTVLLQGGRQSISPYSTYLLTSASAPCADVAAQSRPRSHASDVRAAPHQQFSPELRRSTSQDSADASGGDGSKRVNKRALPKVKR